VIGKPVRAVFLVFISVVQKLLEFVKICINIDQTFYEAQPRCSLLFYPVGRAHISGYAKNSAILYAQFIRD